MVKFLTARFGRMSDLHTTYFILMGYLQPLGNFGSSFRYVIVFSLLLISNGNKSTLVLSYYKYHHAYFLGATQLHKRTLRFDGPSNIWTYYSWKWNEVTRIQTISGSVSCLVLSRRLDGNL